VMFGRRKKKEEEKDVLEEWAATTKLKFMRVGELAYALIFKMNDDTVVPVQVAYNNQLRGWIVLRALVVEDASPLPSLLEKINEYNNDVCGAKLVYNSLTGTIDAIYEFPAKFATPRLIDAMIVDAVMTAVKNRKIVESFRAESPEFV